MTSSNVLRRVQTRLPSGVRGAAQDQAVVAGGQIAAGIGNMLFALVMARLLLPGAFAQLAAFLALYNLLSLPGSSISAVASLTPARSRRARPAMLGAGLALGLALAAGAPWIGPFLRLPVAMVVVLGASGPALGTLALERGRLYGTRSHRRLVASLVAEPAVRLTAGVLMAMAVGGVGGALGVTVGGYGALEIARRVRQRTRATRRARRHALAAGCAVRVEGADEALLGAPGMPAEPVSEHVVDGDGHRSIDGAADGHRAAGHHRAADGHGAAGHGADGHGGPGGATAALANGAAAPAAMGWTAAVFLLLTVVQNQDLLIANRVLSPGAAGQFAALSTLGGLAAFATLTIPLVLLPRSARGDQQGLAPALALTALLGGAVLAVCALFPNELVAGLFGPHYRSVADLVAPYILAMGLLGIARVLAAHRCASHSGKTTAVLGIAAAALQALLIVNFGHDPRAVALSTLSATTFLTVSLAGVVVLERPAVERRRRSAAAALAARWARVRTALAQPATAVLVGSVVVGTALRFIVPRGLWLDEATSVHQATMSFGGMINNLRTTDVHPPLYFSVLWVDVRWLGTGQLAVRVPSIIAGVLTIPALYLVGKEAYDRRTGAVAAAIGVVAPILVWYSQEARMYSMLALFGLLAMWAQLRILRRHPDRVGAWPWVAYVLATVAMVWTQYFGLLQLAVQQLAFLGAVLVRWRRGQSPRSLLWPWLLTSAIVVVALAPLGPFAWHQFIVNQNAGKGFGAPQQVGSAASLNGNHIGVYAVLANFIWSVIGYQPTPTMLLLGALWPLGMLFSLALLGRRRQPATSLLVAAVIGPGLALFLLGQLKAYLFDIRYLFPAVALLTVLLARVVTGLVHRPRALAALTAAAVVVFSIFLVNQQVNGSNPRRYDFNTALAAIDRENRPGDVLLYNPNSLDLLVEYYSPQVRAETLSDRPPLPTAHHEEWVLVSRALQQASDQVAFRKGLTYLRRHSRLVAKKHYANVEVWIFR